MRILPDGNGSLSNHRQDPSNMRKRCTILGVVLTELPTSQASRSARDRVSQVERPIFHLNDDRVWQKARCGKRQGMARKGEGKAHMLEGRTGSREEGRWEGRTGSREEGGWEGRGRGIREKGRRTGRLTMREGDKKGAGGEHGSGRKEDEGRKFLARPAASPPHPHRPSRQSNAVQQQGACNTPPQGLPTWALVSQSG
eukprot:354777-Chlamydomonas_euryale.AAC.2